MRSPERFEQDCDAPTESHSFFVLSAEHPSGASAPRAYQPREASSDEHLVDALARLMGPLAAIVLDDEGSPRIRRRDDPSKPFDPRELLDERVAAAVPFFDPEAR